MQQFDLCVIGSGSGNSLIDERFAGWKIALIDENPVFGGTCLNRGCIPTKMFTAAADRAGSAHPVHDLGVSLSLVNADWDAIRDRVFGRIDPISESGLEWREQSENVTVFRQRASFVDAHTIQVGDEMITADQFVIAAGSRPRLLEVPGVEDEAIAAHIHTSDDIMRLEALPKSMVIVGGGYVAAEFAHVFSALGTQVTVVQRSDVMLRQHDREVSERFTELLSRTVAVQLNQHVVAIEPGERPSEVTVVANDRNGVEYTYEAEQVLVAVGRVPNADSLNLEAAGVGLTATGVISVDANQRTSAPNIWAIGDIANTYELKHVANHEARIVQHNLLHPDDLIKSDHRYVPAAVFSDPQVASVGATEQQLLEWGRQYVKAVQPYSTVAYGWAVEDSGHFVKLLADPTSWRLLGAHIIGPQAANLIQPLIQAITFGQDIREVARGQYWIHPALMEVVENALLSVQNQPVPPALTATGE